MDTIRRCQVKLLDDQKIELSVNVSETEDEEEVFGICLALE